MRQWKSCRHHLTPGKGKKEEERDVTRHGSNMALNRKETFVEPEVNIDLFYITRSFLIKEKTSFQSITILVRVKSTLYLYLALSQCRFHCAKYSSSKPCLYGRRAFSVAGPSLWNNLPVTIREAGTLTTFKSTLQTHLFRIAFKALC